MAATALTSAYPDAHDQSRSPARTSPRSRRTSPGKPPAPRPGLTTYKLSSNENPYPPLPGVVEAATAAAERMNRYPDMGNAELYAALSAELGVPVEDLALATGSVALIYQLVQAFCEPGDEVVFAWRSFEAYPIAVAASAATAVQVPVLADGRHDLDAMAAAVTDRTKVVLVCTPNNPTGPAVTPGRAGRVPREGPAARAGRGRRGVRRVRADGRPGRRRSRRTARRDNVVVTRTFSKAYGLAGFRVGYAVAPAPIAAALRAVSLPFGVSGVAQAAAVASLEREPELLERVDALVGRAGPGRRRAGRGRLGRARRRRATSSGSSSASGPLEFAAAADEAGIVVRPFAGDGARVSIGEPEANDRLVRLAAGFR